MPGVNHCRRVMTALRYFSALVILIGAPSLVHAEKPAACFHNICGMDSYCSCHEVGGKRRCWTTEADCEVDRTCCLASGKCHGMRQDACTAKTAAERKRRDKTSSTTGG